MRPHGPDRRARVLLAHSYYLRYDEKQWRRMKPYPPLATLIAAAVVRERGHEVRVFDAMLADGVDAFRTILASARPAIVAIVEDNFNFLTKMCTLRMREAALEMVGLAKARGCRIAVNGSDSADHASLYLDAGADAVIVGEVETTLTELVDRWAADADAGIADIAGLVLPTGAGARAAGRSDAGRATAGGDGIDRAGRPSRGKRALPVLAGADISGGGSGRAGDTGGERAGTAVRETAPRERLRDLDLLPLPAWDLIDADRYRDAWTRAHGRLSWNMVASRGCPYRCNWCAKPVFGRLYTQRSPAAVAEELRRLKQSVAPDHIWFADDIWGLTADWITDFAREVARRDARTPFMIQSRVNLMTPETVAALADAGAEEVWMGVESGSQTILDAMDKGSTVEQARAATRALRAAGIRAGWFIQLGYLGESWDEILMTRDLVRDERPDAVGVSVSYPLPGTEFYETVREQLGARRNWVDSDELAMLYEGTYETEFYRRIRTLLHAEVEDVPDRVTRDELDRRWAELEADEPRYRTDPAAQASAANA